MSCMMSSPRQLSALATAAENLLNMGYNFAGYYAPGALFEALNDCADPQRFFDEKLIYERLHRLNATAYNGRYNRNPADPADDLPADFPEVPRFVERVAWADGRWEVQPGHYKLLKLLDFFIYQVCEDATQNDPLTKALEEWAHRLQAFIIQNSPAYKEIGWGEV